MAVDPEASGPRWETRHEPPVMWPAADSGYEADPFSPAGTVQREGMLFQGIARRRGGKVVLWIFIGLFVAVPTISLLVAFFAHH